MKFSALAIVLLTLSHSALAKRFGDRNFPSSFKLVAGTDMITRFDDLPLKAQLSDDRYGWSETYWPSNIGGIGYRWNHPNPEPLTYRILTKAEVLNMNMDQLAQLSPAELYDIAQSDYNFTLTKATRVLYSKNDAWWEGICHGWAQAASLYPEPGQSIVRNKEGLKVPFGASDVKGLLAMHEANTIEQNKAYVQIGKKCNVKGKVPEDRGDVRDGNLPIPTDEQYMLEECDDVNAGTFHIVISNMIGLHSKSFVAEVDRMADLWNQPVLGYETNIVGEEPVSTEENLDGVARKIRITNRMAYGEELQVWTAEKAAQHPEWIHWLTKLPVTGTNIQQIRYKNYEYILELDARGNIIGGEWPVVDSTRPDFIWGKKRMSRFVNFRYMYKPGMFVNLPLEGLNRIYRPVKH